jgi:hypothetical protein
MVNAFLILIVYNDLRVVFVQSLAVIDNAQFHIIVHLLSNFWYTCLEMILTQTIQVYFDNFGKSHLRD